LTATTKYEAVVLSRVEYELFCSTWTDWVVDHPGLTRGCHRPALTGICTAAVLLHRLSHLLAVRQPWRRRRRLMILYHRASRRQMAARRALGLTRRQRLDGWLDGDTPFNIAKVTATAPWT
jgi:hypothetical protein